MPSCIKNKQRGKGEGDLAKFDLSGRPLSGQIRPGIKSSFLLPSWFSRKPVSQAPSPVEGALWEWPGSGGVQLNLSRLLGPSGKAAPHQGALLFITLLVRR